MTTCRAGSRFTVRRHRWSWSHVIGAKHTVYDAGEGLSYMAGQQVQMWQFGGSDRRIINQNPYGERLGSLTLFLPLHRPERNSNNGFLFSAVSPDRKSVWSIMSAVNICYTCIRDHFLHVSSCNMEKLECRDSFCLFIHTHTHSQRADIT